MENVNSQRRNFISFFEFEYGPFGIQIQDGSRTFDKISSKVGIIAIKTERTQIHF